MITSESIYKALLSLMRKDKRGNSLSPADLNDSIFIMANKAMWNKYIDIFEQDDGVSIALGPFKVINETITLTSGACVLPVLLDKIAGMPRSIETIAGTPYTRTIDIITSLEYAKRQDDYLTMPSTSAPVCVIGGRPSGNITAIANYNSTVTGTVLVTSAAHGLSTGHYILVNGTTNYNGGHLITKVDANSFYFTATYVSSQTGTWWAQNTKKLTVYPSSITTIYLDYLREPNKPFLDYYINNTSLEVTFLAEGATHVNVPSGSTYRDGTAGGASVYVDSLTVNFEWDECLFDEVLAEMQKIAAIQLQDITITQQQQ